MLRIVMNVIIIMMIITVIDNGNVSNSDNEKKCQKWQLTIIHHKLQNTLQLTRSETVARISVRSALGNEVDTMKFLTLIPFSSKWMFKKSYIICVEQKCVRIGGEFD